MIRITSYFLFISFIFVDNALAFEDLYPCNLEVKRPTSVSTDAGSFFARAYVEDRLAEMGSPSKYRWIILNAPKTGTWVSMFNSNQEFRYKIQSVQFPQSIEQLGVSYRVGFCYLGPVSTGTGDSENEDSTQGSYDLVGTVSTGTISDYIPYAGNVSGYCDLRSAGASKMSRFKTDISPTIIDDDMQFIISLGQLDSGEKVFDTSINAHFSQVPRFCKINAEINEVSSGSRPSELNLNQAQFTLQIDKNLR
jgi:hypothetical protein